MVKSLSAILFLGFLSATSFASSPFQFLAPVPGSGGHDVNRNIVIREGSILNSQSISSEVFHVNGSKSGLHSLQITLADDQKTIVLTPRQPFAFDETVTVEIKKGLQTSSGRIIDDYVFSFTTHRKYSDTEIQNFKSCRSVLWQQELFREGIDTASTTESSEDRDISDWLHIDTNTAPSPGLIFFDAINTSNSLSKCMGYHIINSNGDSVFSRNTVTPYYDDFKITQSGYLSVYNDSAQDIEVMDSNYHLLRRYKPENGYTADNHDFLLLPNHHALLIAEEFQTIDMTVYNPDYSPNATVVGTVIQEFDASKNLIFEWRSFDHVDITEGLHENLAFSFIDYCHTNSIAIDEDGNIIASHRHLDQVTKIDRNTGEFIWRLGGVMNEFTFINEPEPFTYQHDARRIANGDLTLYDNGDFHTIKRSTAKEYQLDEVNKTATLVWSYSHPDINNKPVYFFATGSVQRLPNGNTFIDGGYDTIFDEQPNFWEVTPEGTIVWQATLNEIKNVVSYRARKYDWNPCARVTYRSMKSSNITPHSAHLGWSTSTGASLYRLQFRAQGISPWNEVTTNIPVVNLDSLSSNTIYQWRLLTSCQNPDTISGFTSIKKFKTAVFRGDSSGKKSGFELYPNPAGKEVVLSFDQETSGYEIVKIYNNTGQCIFEEQLQPNSFTFKIPLNNIASGIYLLECTGEFESWVKKLIVE